MCEVSCLDGAAGPHRLGVQLEPFKRRVLLGRVLLDEGALPSRGAST